ncbi:MAG: sulfate adenylyltransferase [Planctomycetaceae bacterium]|nr:sulfate adenylyltransferase [Planctomycetaceae bacterium]
MPLTTAHLDEAARQLQQGRSQPPLPIGNLPAHLQPQQIDDAMAIQDALHRRLSESGHGHLVGTKIGCTTPVMQEFLGMPHPCAGGIFDSTVRSQDGSFDFDSFLHVGVECEIAVQLGSALCASDAPHTRASVARAVSAFFAAIEIVDDRYVDFSRRIPDSRTWVADDFFGAGVVLGEAVHVWQKLDLADLEGVMRINGTEVGRGFGRDIIHGHPLEALVWLANETARRGRELPSGWIVMLGSVVQTKWVAPGDTVDVEITGLGNARARFQTPR